MKNALVVGFTACSVTLLAHPERSELVSATNPCLFQPELKPGAPTNLRIIGRTLLTSIEGTLERAGLGGPYVGDEAPAVSTYDYFDALSLRADCRAAYAMRSQAELDSIKTEAVSEKKWPVLYDAAMDAALVTIVPTVSTDSQQKLFPVQLTTGSMLLTWDFQFDNRFTWLQEGNMVRHKAWRLDPGPWLALKTDYQHAAHVGRFAEFFVSLPSTAYLSPGTTRGDREILFPRLAEFYMDPSTWTRAWIFVEGLDQPVCYLSVWIADERRDPVQLYNRLALIPPSTGLSVFRLEYDTSADTATNPYEAHSWNRNLVILANVTAADVRGMLQRPTP